MPRYPSTDADPYNLISSAYLLLKYCMNPVDLDKFRTKHGVLNASGKQRLPQHNAGGWFLKGPIPGSWLHRAAKLPGRALHAGIALWYLAGLQRSAIVKPTWKTWAKLGLPPDSARRGLGALERDGLIAIERHPGRCPLVRILDAKQKPTLQQGDEVSESPSDATQERLTS
jgi:hypothetical protein